MGLDTSILGWRAIIFGWIQVYWVGYKYIGLDTSIQGGIQGLVQVCLGTKVGK